jgi:hypothetical protein
MRSRRLFAAEAGEGILVVDCDGTAATATIASTTFTAELAATSATATTAELATITSSIASEATSVAAFAAVSSITTATATSTTVATTTAVRASWSFFEGVVDVQEFLAVLAFTLAASLLLALEVVFALFLGDLLSRFPLLSILGALVRSTGFLQAETLKLLLSLLSKIIGIRLGVVLWLRFRRLSSWLCCRGGLTILVTALSNSLFAILGSKLLTGSLVGPFSIASLLTPAVTDLLLMIAA